MIITEYVEVKIAPINHAYWKNKGYDVGSTGGRGGKNTGQVIRVKVSELLPNSNASVQCKCESCGEEYTQRFSRDTTICYPCRRTEQMQGNKFGASNKGRKLPSLTGELHHSWNPNKPAYKRFLYRVQRLTEETYAKHKDQLNPDNRPRTLCGVDGGYQLDHIISVKRGFELGMTPIQLAAPENLQMLPWSTNRSKWDS